MELPAMAGAPGDAPHHGGVGRRVGDSCGGLQGVVLARGEVQGVHKEHDLAVRRKHRPITIGQNLGGTIPQHQGRAVAQHEGRAIAQNQRRAVAQDQGVAIVQLQSGIVTKMQDRPLAAHGLSDPELVHIGRAWGKVDGKPVAQSQIRCATQGEVGDQLVGRIVGVPQMEIGGQMDGEGGGVGVRVGVVGQRDFSRRGGW